MYAVTITTYLALGAIYGCKLFVKSVTGYIKTQRNWFIGVSHCGIDNFAVQFQSQSGFCSFFNFRIGEEK
jgi:hypothetical protein